MEKLTRKQFLRLSAMSVAAAALAACGGPKPTLVSPTATFVPPTPTPAPTKPKGDGLVIFPYDDPPFWREQAKKFEEKTGLKMEYQVVPFPQLLTRYQTALLGGERLDVIHVHDLWTRVFASMGLLQPLNDRITKEMIAQYPTGLFDKLSYTDAKGTKHTYAIPLYLWTTNFLYRKDIFDARGIKVPQTFTEMRDLSKQLQGVAGKDVYSFLNALGGTGSATMFSIVFRGEGGEILSDGGPSFNNEVGIAVLENIVGLVKDGSVDPTSFTYTSGSLVCDPFAQGKALMVFGPPPTYTIANDPSKSKIVGLVSFDLMPGGSKNRSATYHETGGRAIPVTAKDSEAAWRYIEFVTQMEEVVDMAITLGRVPARLDALNDSRVQEKYPIVKIVPEQLKYPSGMSVVHEKGPEISKALADEVVAACMFQKTAKQALADAEAKINAILTQ